MILTRCGEDGRQAPTLDLIVGIMAPPYRGYPHLVSTTHALNLAVHVTPKPWQGCFISSNGTLGSNFWAAHVRQTDALYDTARVYIHAANVTDQLAGIYQ
jgi:hypothetical protein